MWKRHRIWLTALVLAAVGGITWLLLSSDHSEPVYQGKTLSFWLSCYSRSDSEPPAMSEADDAIRHIGTNGIPTMLKMLQAKDSGLTLILTGLLRKQPFVKMRYDTPAENGYSEASLGLIALGADASNAVPALIQIYDKNISRFSRAETCRVLCQLGPLAKQAVPSFLRNLTNSQFSVRQDAEDGLSRILSEPALVVPAMIKALQDPDPNLVANAVVCLGDYGSEARMAVPALTEMLKTEDAGLKQQVKTALKGIDSEAAAKLGIK